MARVNDIITRARDTLAEATPKRWKTDKLLRTLSEAQKKLAQELLCVRETCTIQLCDGYHTYQLDTTNVITIGGKAVRISGVINHAGDNVRFVETSIMKDIDTNWRTKTGIDVEYIVYNKKKPLQFRVYPIPTAAELTEVGASFNTVDEPIADAATICEAITTVSNFDITTELAPIKLELEFFHVPPPVVTIADTNLLVPEEFDIAIKHYIVGMLLRDDLDAQNRALGLEELKMFDMQFDAAQKLTDDDFVEQKEEHYAAVSYNAQII